jgi:ribosome maturation factor RimP
MPSAQAGLPPDVARQQLLALLAPVVESAGYDLEDLTVRVVGRRTMVRVIVDADDGVDLDGVALLSRAVSDVLDDNPALVNGPYVLEVTSPGVDRPLTEHRHWRRAAGRLVHVAVDGAPQVARVIAADDDGVHLDIDGVRRQVPWAGLARGRVQVEFNRPSDAARDGG